MWVNEGGFEMKMGRQRHERFKKRSVFGTCNEINFLVFERT